jgi:hypothetical protein
MNLSRRRLLLAGSGLLLSSEAMAQDAPEPLGPRVLRRFNQTSLRQLTLQQFTLGLRAPAVRLPDGDVIRIQNVGPLTTYDFSLRNRRPLPNDIQIQLFRARGIWWKSLQIVTWQQLPPAHDTPSDRPVRKITTAELSDRNSSPTFRIKKWDLFTDGPGADRQGGIIFSKAKALGVHTEMYFLPGSELRSWAGRIISITWERD